MTTRLPDPIIVGDTLNFLVSSSLYPAPTWTLNYRLVPRSSTLSEIAFASAAEGSDHRINILPAASAVWEPAAYQWSAYFGDGTDRHTVDGGVVTLQADPAAIEAGYDGRSHVRIVYDAITAVIERRATIDQEEYTINNRSLKRTPIADLLALRDRYKAELEREELAAGLGSGRRVYVRFNGRV
jgi:hypothetical protein